MTPPGDLALGEALEHQQHDLLGMAGGVGAAGARAGPRPRSALARQSRGLAYDVESARRTVAGPRDRADRLRENRP